MSDRDLILQRLPSDDAAPEMTQIRAALQDERTKVLRGRSSQLSVSEAKSLWGTRMLNADLTGQNYVGLAEFLSKLATLAPDRSLEQFAFVTEAAFGNLFFDATSHEFLGVTVADRPASELHAA